MSKIKPIPLDDDYCTCDKLSWRGKGHASGCAATIVQALEKECAKLEQRLAIIDELRFNLGASNGMIERARDKGAIDKAAANALIRHNRKLINKRM